MLHALAPRVYYTECTAETDRPNLGYIRGDRYALMVDAGNSPAHTAAYLAALSERGFPPPDHVFLTHHHWDHTYGLASLAGVTAIAGERTAARMEEAMGYVWDMPHFDALIESGRRGRGKVEPIVEKFTHLCCNTFCKRKETTPLGDLSRGLTYIAY